MLSLLINDLKKDHQYKNISHFYRDNNLYFVFNLIHFSIGGIINIIICKAYSWKCILVVKIAILIHLKVNPEM